MQKRQRYLLAEPVLGKNDNGLFTATFTGEVTRDINKFAIAFARSAANNKAMIPVDLLKHLEQDHINSPVELSLAISEVQKKVPNSHNRFTGCVKVESGYWAFSWYCYPYYRTPYDQPGTPENPNRTLIRLKIGEQPDLLELTITGGRQTSVARRAIAAMGHNVPLAWTTAKGLAEHPEM